MQPSSFCLPLKRFVSCSVKRIFRIYEQTHTAYFIQPWLSHPSFINGTMYSSISRYILFSKFIAAYAKPHFTYCSGPVVRVGWYYSCLTWIFKRTLHMQYIGFCVKQAASCTAIIFVWASTRIPKSINSTIKVHGRY